MSFSEIVAQTRSKTVEPPHEVAPLPRVLSVPQPSSEDLAALQEIFNHVHTHEVKNFVLDSGAVIESARVGFTVYSAERGRLIDMTRFERPELDLGKPIILVCPALTGGPALFQLEGMERSQGPGWAKFWANPSMISERPDSSTQFLDLNKFTIVCVEHFGGNGVASSTSAAELDADVRMQVRFSDGVRLIEQALYDRGVRSLHAVIGGSIGGGQAIEWLMRDKIDVERIFDISGCGAKNDQAKEFFAIQRDIVLPDFDGNRLADALDKNLSALIEAERTRSGATLLASDRGAITAYELLVGDVLDELRSLSKEDSESRRSECARRVGFLLFVPPPFYDGKLERCGGAEGLREWFVEEGQKFAERFSPEALAALCNMVVHADPYDARLVAERLRERQTQLISYYVIGDTLFPGEEQEQFGRSVRAHLSESEIEDLHAMVRAVDLLTGHDNFLSREFFDSGGRRLRQFL